jgi:hypothetical protein
LRQRPREGAPSAADLPGENGCATISAAPSDAFCCSAQIVRNSTRIERGRDRSGAVPGMPFDHQVVEISYFYSVPVLLARFLKW